jgi:hypothetical protein
MNRRDPNERKSYSRQRMVKAIERAMTADSGAEQDKAQRWAAAWGLLGGIRSPGVRLRRTVLADRRVGGTEHDLSPAALAQERPDLFQNRRHPY